MKTSKLLFVSLAAGLAGVALAELGNAQILLALPGVKLFAIGISVALLGFAAYDYSRRQLPLRPRTGNVVRPALPATWRAAAAPAMIRPAAARERTAA